MCENQPRGATALFTACVGRVKRAAADWRRRGAGERAPPQVFYLTKKACREGPQAVAFTIPIFEPLPAQYYVRCVSNGWP